MKQHRSIQRKISSAVAGLAVTASVLTVSALAGPTAASAAPLAEASSSVEPTSVYTEFTDWTTPQEGWTVSHAGSQNIDWAFSNVSLVAPTGSEGTFAIIAGDPTDPSRYGSTGVDASLVSPAVDLTGQNSPTVEFDAFSSVYTGSVLYGDSESVELSLDGGQSWSTAWQAQPGNADQHVSVPIPQAAGHSNVLVRFHFTGYASIYGPWRLDNVFIGTK